jgi:hypothetical protein
MSNYYGYYGKWWNAGKSPAEGWEARGKYLNELAEDQAIKNEWGVFGKPFFSTVEPLPEVPGSALPKEYPYGYGGGSGDYGYPYYYPSGGGGGFSPSQNYMPGWYTRLLTWNVNRG